ncbi:hypothetical protein ACVTE8_16460, partial [Staphylococcus aureus]
ALHVEARVSWGPLGEPVQSFGQVGPKGRTFREALARICRLEVEHWPVVRDARPAALTWYLAVAELCWPATYKVARMLWKRETVTHDTIRGQLDQVDIATDYRLSELVVSAPWLPKDAGQGAVSACRARPIDCPTPTPDGHGCSRRSAPYTSA